jgi:hypothetical protein
MKDLRGSAIAPAQIHRAERVDSAYKMLIVTIRTKRRSMARSRTEGASSTSDVWQWATTFPCRVLVNRCGDACLGLTA